MAKKQKTELPEIDIFTLKDKITDAAVILLKDSVPNKKVVKNVVKTYFDICDNLFKVDMAVTYIDKREVMNDVFDRISL